VYPASVVPPEKGAMLWRF